MLSKNRSMGINFSKPTAAIQSIDIYKIVKDAKEKTMEANVSQR